MPHPSYQNNTIDLSAELDDAFKREQLNPPFHHITTQYAMELTGKAEVVRKRTPSRQSHALELRRAQLNDSNDTFYGIERIYEDRVVLMPYSGCLCRYCAKKVLAYTGSGKFHNRELFEAALEHIRNDQRINTAVITGGDPMANPRRILMLLDRLANIPHLNRIRINTRHILFQPERITEEFAERVASYNHIDTDFPLRSRNVSLTVSFNHADELLPEVITAIHKFTRRGVIVRGQTVLLKGLNDNHHALKNLIDHFLAIGVVPYYLLHCADVIGMHSLRTSVQKGLDLLDELKAFSGTYSMPYAYTTPIGKHRIASGQQLEYEHLEGERFIRARSPYKADRFKTFSNHLSLPPLHEIDEHGYVISRYRDGNDSSFGQ